LSKIEVNTVEPQCGTTLTLGASGDTVTIPSGATISNLGTAAGFGSTGEVSWNTTKVTTGFTATSGVGYFADTSSAAFTITLPASPSAGNVVAISDYSGNFGTNAVTVGRNSSNINGSASDFSLSKDNVTAQFIYVDATQGWRVVFTGSQTGEGLSENYIIATGGTITEDGNDKIHTFTGPGTFTVTSLADCSSNNLVDYLVVAGGAGGGHNNSGGNSGGGGGAGGLRFSATTYCSSSPLKAPAALPVSAQAYPITVGGGGTGASGPFTTSGAPGNTATFSTITSAGGGGGGTGGYPNPGGAPAQARTGGSGGGGVGVNGPGPAPGAAGNTPPVSPAQGNAGGTGNNASDHQGGGGGGFTAAGQNGACGGDGGDGLAISITGSPVAYGGGGGGGRGAPSSAPAVPQGGLGGGGNGSDNPIPGGNPSGSPASSGTANTGGGGGGTNFSNTSGSGGSGIVVIRYRFK